MVYTHDSTGPQVTSADMLKESAQHDSAQPLKRLGSATSLATQATTQAELLYKKARSLVPGFLEPSIARVEETVSTAAAPVVAKAQDAGDKLLHFADNRIDKALSTADQVLCTTKSGVSAIHQSGMQTFNKTSERYFEMLFKAADWVADRLNPVKGVQAARETLGAALQTARKASDPDVAVSMGADAWNKFAAHPAVAKLLNTAEPATNLGYQAFLKMHDTVVAHPLYKRTLDTTASTLGWATTLTPYRLGAQFVYPFVQPVADPALETLNRSKVVHQVMDYWRPVAVM